MRVIVEQPFVSTIVNNEVVSGIDLNFPNEIQVSQIKQRVSALTHIPLEYFELALLGKRDSLHPDSMMSASTRQKTEPTVRLYMIIDVPEREGCIQIIVKSLTGKNISLLVKLDDSVALLKYFIFKKEGVPPDYMRLIFSGKQLEDDRVLHDYKIEWDSTIHLVPRLRGCGSTRVTVIGPNGDEYIYTSPCCCYVTTVKSIVQLKAGIPIGEQHLLLEDIEVEDGEKLKRYTDQTEVRLRLQVIPVA